MVGRAIPALAASVLALVTLAGAFAQSPAAPQSGAAAFVSSPPGATACLGCHGRESTALPSLSRLSAGEIEAALSDYREDKRAPTLMNRIAKGFTAEESKAIAAWLAAHPGQTP